MGIYGDNASKYWEAGLAAIPLYGKVPAVPAWETYSKALPPEEKIAEWSARFAKCNLGIVMGEASKIVCLDIDDDKLLEKLPPSPVARRGKKGEARFFKYAPGMRSRSWNSAKIDFLADSRQVVLPPSIHPETKAPYVWTGMEDLLKGLDDLPEIDFGRLEKFADAIENRSKDIEIVPARTEHGRNNALKEIASAMIFRGILDVNKIALELMRYDVKFPKPLFKDATEGNLPNLVFHNAQRFVLSVMTSILKGPGLPETHTEEDVPVVEAINVVERSAFDANEPKPPMPKHAGLLTTCLDYLDSFQDQDVPALRMGATVSYMSALASNRVRYESTWPNEYVFLVAPSGRGKSSCFDLLTEHLPSKMFSGEDEASVQALLRGFENHPLNVKVGIVDEAESILKAMSKGGVHQEKLMSGMCNIYSKANKHWMGMSYAGEAKKGACWNPCYIALFGTTPAALENEYQARWSKAGFLPRFLLFQERSALKFRPAKPRITDAWPEILEMQKDILRFQVPMTNGDTEAPVEAGDGIHPSLIRFHPRNLILTKSAKELYLMFDDSVKSERERLTKNEPENPWIPFLARHTEHVMKLAMLQALSRHLSEVRTIDIDDLEWAIATTEWCYKNSAELVGLLNSDSEYEKLKTRVLKYIGDRGVVKRRDLYRVMKSQKRQLEEVIEYLLISEQIVKVEIATPTSKRSKKTSGFQISS